MGFYGNLILENQKSLSDIDQLIESGFEFLNESAEVSIIKKAINDLKNKDKIEQKDIDEIAQMLKKVSDQKTYVKLVVSLINFIVSYIGAFVTLTDFKKGMLIEGVSLLTSGVILKTTYGPMGTEAYNKLIKLEAKINNKIKKIQSLESETEENKEQLKELNKSLEIIAKVKPAFKNSVANRESAVLEESVLLEFKGNENKTEAFKIILDEVAGICEFNYEKIKISKKCIDDMISYINQGIKAKDEKTTGEFVVKVRETGRKAGKDIDDFAKELGINFSISIAVFRKDLKKFTNKYSEISMAEKKRIATKLEQMKKQIYDISSQYSRSNKEFESKVLSLYDEIAKAGKSATLNTPYETLTSWLQYIINECNYTIGDIDGIIKDLNIEKTEKSIIYKALNPIKK